MKQELFTLIINIILNVYFLTQSIPLLLRQEKQSVFGSTITFHQHPFLVDKNCRD